MTGTEVRISACAFTGHRAVKKEHNGRLQELLARAIDYAYSRGARSFIAGGALGFDTIAIPHKSADEKLKIPTGVSVIPIQNVYDALLLFKSKSE